MLVARRAGASYGPGVTIELLRGGRSVGEQLLAPLSRWSGRAPYRAQLHPGDVGWHLRFRDDELEADGGAFLLWSRDGEPVAAALAEAPLMRTVTAPHADGDVDLGRAMAASASAFTSVETLSATPLRRRLVDEGWTADLDSWVLLFKELTAADATLDDDPHTRRLTSGDDVAARVEVQRAAFTSSTFSIERWDTMAGSPAYDARFDLVTWSPDGKPAAAATAWWAGPGAVAILEPVGTHADHVRKGYGHRVVVALMAALAAAGASGVRVHTPLGNTAAVAAYRSCGLRPVDVTTDLVRRPA